MRHTLDDLSPTRSYRVRDWFDTLVPYLLPDSRCAIVCTLRDMFVWSGVIILRHGRFYVHESSLWQTVSASTTLHVTDEALYLDVSHFPMLTRSNQQQRHLKRILTNQPYPLQTGNADHVCSDTDVNAST